MKSAPALPHELHWGQRILLVGGSEFRQGLRSNVLRGHGLQVEMAATLAEGPSLLKSRTFDWVLLDAHSELPGAVMDFCERVARVVPGQRIAFLVGPPAYVSLKWPGEVLPEDKTKEQSATVLKTAA